MNTFKILRCTEVRHTLGQHPAVTRCHNGDILVLYGDYTDMMEGQTSYVVRSRDNGLTWSDVELILPPRWGGGGSHTSLGMQTLRSGRVLLPYNHGGNHKADWATPMRFICLRSDDHGQNWQGWDEQPLGMQQFGAYGKVIELPGGDLICPGWGLSSREDPASAGCRIIRSRDGGVTWGEPAHLIRGDGVSETDITLLPDGRILATIRIAAAARGDDKAKLEWTWVSWSSDGGRTWSEAEQTNVLGQNFTAWVTSDGTLVGACRGIDGTGRLHAHEIRTDDEHHTPQKGYGIHFFTSSNAGKTWDFQMPLPDPAGRAYTAWHESGEPGFCNLPDGQLMVVYYSYDESIAQTLGERKMPAYVEAQYKRIPHAFKRRICACVLKR